MAIKLFLVMLVAVGAWCALDAEDASFAVRSNGAPGCVY